MTMRRYGRKALCIVAVLAAPLFILCAIFVYGVPVPYWDQWELVPMLQRLNNHSLQIADLWAQQNEHRILLPRAVMLLLAKLTGWNIYFEFLASYAIAFTTFVLLWSMLRRTFDGKLPIWIAVALSLVVFSPIQYENWLWGWQIQFFMANLGVVAAAWSLHRWPDSYKGLAVAIAAAAFSSFSLSSGLFLWIAMVPLLIFAGPRNWRHILIWCASSAAVFSLYFHNYVKPPVHPSLGSFIEAPGRFMRYVAIYLGSPLGFGKPDAAVSMGILTLLVATVVFFLLRKSRYGETGFLMPWIAIGLQAALCALGTAIGRSGYGARQAMSSRYSTFASLLLIAVMAVVAKWLAMPRQRDSSHRGNGRKAFAAALLIIFAVTYALTFAHSLKAMESRRKQLQTCRDELMAFPNTSEEALGQLYPLEMIQDTRARAQALREMGMILPPEPLRK